MPDRRPTNILIGAEQLQSRVSEMAAEIRAAYPDNVHIIAVLKGAFMFMSDLVRHMDGGVSMDFMAVSSYAKGTTSSGEVRLMKDLDTTLDGKDVLIVEDIVDSGLTLSWLLRNLATRHPRSLRVCTLMRKPDAVRDDVDITYVGFDIPNEFVVGYGLDWAERYRDLSYIGTLDPKVYEEY